jgi:predicted transcriptional regulator
MSIVNDTITKRDFNKLMAKLATIEQAINQRAVVDDLISEEEAAKLLNRSVSTLQTKVYKGLISTDAYTIGQGGKRFYYKSKLIGA